MLDRIPSHDIETWEWFDVPGGESEKAESRIEKEIFDPGYFGGVEARRKWGYLASRPTGDKRDSPGDIQKRQSIRGTRKSEKMERDTAKTM